ncbi:MAG: hypothetical protein JSW55_11275 [Chloroflexota bacterium]|nr:MAG: hypothetical protein JSW55_11275 [Chloroflexota bacterium]
MEEILLERAELLSLLEMKGIDQVIGISQDQLPSPESFERQIILDDGRSRLLEQELLTVAEDHYEIDGQLDTMLSALADPQTVLRLRRSAPESDEEVWSWYFLTGSDMVQVITSGSEQFEIGRLVDDDAALAQIDEVFPLDPMPESTSYRAVVDQEDAELVRALADDWDEVPALTILEADGLSPVGAIGLFDDVTEPRWRGEIDFMACKDGEVKVHHRLLVLQGQEGSWLAWQDDPDKSELQIQSASAGALREQVQAYWSEVGP